MVALAIIYFTVDKLNISAKNINIIRALLPLIMIIFYFAVDKLNISAKYLKVMKSILVIALLGIGFRLLLLP
jgi:hypothetical protein